MPLKSEINAVVNRMLVIPPVAPATENTAPGFLFGTAKEINYKQENTNVWPMVCMYPKQAIDITPVNNGSNDNAFNLYLEFLYLTKFENDTDNNEVYVNNALALANKFVSDLKNYRAVSGEPTYFKEIKNVRAFPIYNKHDENTTGVVLTLVVKKRQDDYLLNC